MSENKEEILANFQSITGIEDVGEAFSHLEETNWDLMSAIHRAMPQDDDVVLAQMDHSVEQSPSHESQSQSDSHPARNNLNSTRSMNHFHNRWDNPNIRSPPMNVNPIGPDLINNIDEDVAASNSVDDANIIDLTQDIALSSRHFHGSLRMITFNIHFNENVYTIVLPPHATVDHLKTKIMDLTRVPKCRQAIRGWPPSRLQEAQKPTAILSTLELNTENELIMIDLTEEGFMDFENDEMQRRLGADFMLNIIQQPGGKLIPLKVSGHRTIQEIKHDVFCVSDIPVRHQEWTGWPPGCTNSTTVAQSGIEFVHNFILSSSAPMPSAVPASQASVTPQPSVSSSPTNRSTNTSADEFEDASDFNTCEEYFTDSPPVQPPTRHLIPNNTDDEVTGSLQFVENYVERFGEPHPVFFTGSLESAIKEACHKPARDRKLLAVYLHHGESILTNVFCDHLMKHESIIQTFAMNFLLYGWDLTFESNKHLFLSSVTACISNTASLTVRTIPIDKLPAIMVIGKSRLSGRSSCEVLSVIHGNVGLDDLLSRLLETVEMYNEHLKVEIREDDESAARAQVKFEQDIAYQETLQADMAKEADKRQKEAAIAAERKRLESEKAEEDEKRESIRLVAEQSLPTEPLETDKNISKIRVRKPTGDFLERRFFISNTLQDLLNFVTSNGFLIDEYKLISSWPRRDLTSMDPKETLGTLKLYPQETVILEER